MDIRPLVSQILSDSRLGLPPLADEQSIVLQFQAYIDLFCKWNKRINLSADRDPVTLVTRHVFDSLLYSRALDGRGEVADVGSGAGFPGIPLKLVFPEYSFVLVEAQRKRVSFLQEVIRQLKLTGIEVVQCRAEDLPPIYKERFQYVIFKAVAPISDCLAWGSPLLAPGGRIIVKKEPQESSSSVPSFPGLQESPSIAIHNYSGVASQLTIFQKCST